ncbi:hypothetical protein GO290_02729 [Ralstonia solanacearum]|nr:hypothetical protein [Ralstonia solanacearum]
MQIRSLHATNLHHATNGNGKNVGLDDTRKRKDMKKSDWMSEAGRASGDRHARLEEQRLRARSPVEVFADESVSWLEIIYFVAGVLGAIFLADAVRPAIYSLIDGAKEPYTLSWVLGWLISRLAAFAVGVMAAFLAIDVPLAIGLLCLKKYRPELFQPRRG